MVSEERVNLTREESDRELERRLEILETNGADDPARKDLPAIDYILLGVFVVLTSVIMFVWGY